MKTVISPSILSADFADMGNAVRRLEQCGADWVHCDVMDGVFVPNITFGQKMVSDISGLTDLVTDVHLMITEPIRYVEEFVRCGADIVTFHVEAAQSVAQTIAAIKKAGAKAGLALKPATPVDAVAPFIDGLDMILVMSVEPGFGGQSFMPCALDKIRLARKLAGTRNIRIQGDGGISEKNAASAVQAGADERRIPTKGEKENGEDGDFPNKHGGSRAMYAEIQKHTEDIEERGT